MVQNKPTAGRPLAFGRDAALEAAMDLFWERGYDSTGMSDLEGQAFFQNKAFWITGILENDILARAQAVLFNALKAHDKPERVVLLERKL